LLPSSVWHLALLVLARQAIRLSAVLAVLASLAVLGVSVSLTERLVEQLGLAPL
jgi:hypothetical protein